MSEREMSVIPEDALRQSGRLAQKNNILAAKIVAETIRTTLGPKGMDKMLVDQSGNVTVTNDGVTILKEMQIEHPAAKMVVEVAKTQEDEVGDGTTTAVVFAGELLKQAESLLEKEVHPTIITKGYQLAAAKSQDVLKNMAKHVTIADVDILQKIAMTAMTGKGAESSKETLSKIVVDAVIAHPKRESIRVEKKVGAETSQSELIKGVVLDKVKVHPGMPASVEHAKIALLNVPLEIRDTEIDAKISITEPTQMQQFLDMEESMLKTMVEQIAESGANVVLCQKGIDDVAQYLLSKKGIYAARRVKRSDVEAISKATGASIVTNLADLSTTDLGAAGRVEEVMVNDEAMTYIRNCPNPKSVTILVRGSTEHVISEVKRALEDAIGDVICAIDSRYVVAGAGACEVEISKQLHVYADSLSGKEQLAVKAFSLALDILPQTLAENAGLDPIDVLAELKSKHDEGEKWAGINVFTGKIMDAFVEGVLEPISIKSQAISSATEVATMILRIDDVIAANRTEE